MAATLAGALGKPVWKIAGANAHWSWADRERSEQMASDRAHLPQEPRVSNS